MSDMRLLLAAAAVSAVIVFGTTGAEVTSSDVRESRSSTPVGVGAGAAAPHAEFDRLCPTHAEGPEPDDVALPDARRDVVAGRVAIVFARVAARREFRRRPPYGRRAWILKTPVVIRAGAPVVVRVAARDRRYVALDYDVARPNPRDPGVEHGHAAVRFHPCPPDTPRFTDGKPIGEWTGYPGGLIVERRRCVTFEFLEEGRPSPAVASHSAAAAGSATPWAAPRPTRR